MYVRVVGDDTKNERHLGNEQGSLFHNFGISYGDHLKKNASENTNSGNDNSEKEESEAGKSEGGTKVPNETLINDEYEKKTSAKDM